MQIKAQIASDNDCTLTCDHAASSYGLPVLIGSDGKPVDPAAAGVVNVAPFDGTADAAEFSLFIESARAAGYEVCS